MARPASMDAVFRALGSPVRRRMLDVVKNRPGCSVNDVWGCFRISRIAVMKHLEVLAKAGLLHSRKVGRRRELYINVIPLRMIYDRWTTDYSALWAGELTAVKYRAEQKGGRHEGNP